MDGSSNTTVPSSLSAIASNNSIGNDGNKPSSADHIDSSNNNNNRSLARLRSTKSAPSQWKSAPSHSCISRPSSLSSKSRASQGSSTAKPHAYFASSEEESEAELDEKDSHSSHDNNRISSHGNSYGHSSSQQHRVAGSNLGKSNLRASKKLAEIASKVGGSSHLHASLHSSRVRMTIPQNHHDTTTPHGSSSAGGRGSKESGSANSKPIASIYKTTSSHGSVPPPPQTVTVAVAGKTSNGVIASDVGPQGSNMHPPDSTSLPHPLPTSSTLRSNGRSAAAAASASAALHHVNLPPYSSQPKRIRKKKSSASRHKHLPRGLPVFKDPRSCMWTSTYDANAPSEDRYSSLVNVLLRPPKTPRGIRKKKKESSDHEKGNNVANGNNGGTKGNNNGGGSQSGSWSDGSSEEEENVGKQQQNAAAGGTNASSTAGGGKNANSNTPTSTEDDEDNTSLIRLSLWSVIDGHGGGCVATYGAEVLLPHIAASVARALKSEIVDRGVCNVNGQLRDANALDLDGLIRSSDRSRHVGKSQVRQREAGIDVVNPNSIHYRSPYEDSESEGDLGVDHVSRGTRQSHHHHPPHPDGTRSESESEAESEAPVSVASSLLPGHPITHGESVSSVKTSVKTAVSPVTQHAPMGTHSPAEIASITRAITDSFLAVDEGWINSIDPVTTHQTSCVSNGRWNAGACALVVFTVQRLDWCRSSRVDHETHHRDRGAAGFDDTSHNKDAARLRKLDYAAKSKSVSSLSDLSSTSSITTEANTSEKLGEESEITETEDDDVSDIFGPRRRRRKNRVGGHHHHHHAPFDDDPHHSEGVFIATPADCKCHYYRPHDAMLYTAHVGDCRAVMLGSAPPRTIKVPPEGDTSLSLDHADTSEDDETSSVSIADEISSSEGHDSDSSEDLLDPDQDHFIKTMGRGRPSAGAAPGMLGYVRRASKRQRMNENNVIEQPFVPLPPLRRESSSEESGFMTMAHNHRLLETEDEEDEIKEIRSVRSGSPTQMDRPPSPTQLVADPVHPPPLPLSMLMRPIDLTTDHSAYNPAEVTAVLRRCNNAPKAISSASSGGIKRVAGSLAVTRALGDAYLKTPRLSFSPYKRHAPYITARPEVNCRVLTKGADRILTLASDGVWERASGDDILRWVRNYYNARIAGVKEQHLHGMYDSMCMDGDEQHDPYVVEAERSFSRRKQNRLKSNTEEEVLVTGSTGGKSVEVDSSGGNISSEGTTGEEKTEGLTPPVDNTTPKKLPEDAVPATSFTVDEKVEDSDAATTLETTAATTNADESTAITTKAGKKRKHSSANAAAAADDSASCRSESTTGSPRGSGRGGGGAVMSHSAHHHLRSSPRTHSQAIPTVSEVIVRKVLNKVRKTRNISSLRMLMSLPKGRARRSKHDDITATVVDLSVSESQVPICIY